MKACKALVISAIIACVDYAGVPQAAWAADDLLATIKSRGVIRGCDVEYAPWNVRNPATESMGGGKRRFAGFDCWRA